MPQVDGSLYLSIILSLVKSFSIVYSFLLVYIFYPFISRIKVIYNFYSKIRHIKEIFVNIF
jgi:hypothetical protein